MFNAKDQKVEPLGFGASREYADKFVEPYLRTVLPAIFGRSFLGQPL